MQSVDKEQAELIASLVATLQGDTPPETKMPCEVTVCMPVKDAVFTVHKALRSTWFRRQGLPVKLFMTENGSIDGTQEFVRGLRDDSVTRDTWLKWSRWRKLKVFEVEPEVAVAGQRFPGEYYNIRNCFQKMFLHVDTPYVLTLDADVDAPSGSIRTMLEALKRDEKLGIVGIKYDDNVTHVKHGLSMMRTSNAREWASRLQPDACMCSQWCKMSEDADLKCVNLPGITARHRKNEQD
jgi:hypothetical protein